MEKFGMYSYIGGCDECDISWESRNVAGVAVQHARKYGHHCWYETGFSIDCSGDQAPSTTVKKD